MNDSVAVFNFSEYYRIGKNGLPIDPQKSFDFCIRAAELGNTDACRSAALFYNNGVVVPKDIVNARKYTDKAVEGGNIIARHQLGVEEWGKCNYQLAGRHCLVSAADGYAPSLEGVAEFYKIKLVTKTEYSTILTSYRNIQMDEWSIERERAAATISQYSDRK